MTVTPPVTEATGGGAGTSRRWAELRSGRAALTLLVPLLGAHVLARVVASSVLSMRGAAIVGGEVQGFAVATGRVIEAVLALVLVSTGALWGAGAAAEMIVRERNRNPATMRHAWAWPLRHPAAAGRVALIAGGAGVSGVVVGVAVADVLDRSSSAPPAWGSPAWMLVVVLPVALLAHEGCRLVHRVLAGSEGRPGLLAAVTTVPPGPGAACAVVGAVVLGVLGDEVVRLGPWPLPVAMAADAVTVAVAVLVLVHLVRDIDPDRGVHRPTEPAAASPARGRWVTVACLIALVAVAPALLLSLSPWGLARYDRAEPDWSMDGVRVSAASDHVVLTGGYRIGGCTRAGCTSWGTVCPDCRWQQSPGGTASVLSEDGELVWTAVWEPVGTAEATDPDPEMVLRLRALSVAALPTTEPDDGRQTVWPEQPADPTALVTDLEVARAPWSQIGPFTEYEPDRVPPVALAEQAGAVVLAAASVSRQNEAELLLARCTTDGCELDRVRQAVAVASDGPPLDLALGADGTAYVTVHGRSGDSSAADGIDLLVSPPGGDLTARVRLDLAEEGTGDGLTSSVDVGADGSVWVLVRVGSDPFSRLLRCTDAACTSWDEHRLVGVSSASGTLAVDTTGRPMIVTSALGSDPGVRLLSCRDTSCGEVDQVLLVGPPGADWSAGSAVGIDLDGELPVVVVRAPELVLRCGEPRCGAA